MELEGASSWMLTATMPDRLVVGPLTGEPRNIILGDACDSSRTPIHDLSLDVNQLHALDARLAHRQHSEGKRAARCRASGLVLTGASLLQRATQVSATSLP